MPHTSPSDARQLRRAPVPAQPRPPLAKIAQPQVDERLRAAISRVKLHGNGARVRVATRFGEAVFRYPAGLPPTAFDGGDPAADDPAAGANDTQRISQRIGGGGR